MTITYALMQTYEKICEAGDRARLYNKACVNMLLMNGDAVVGCEYTNNKKETLTEFGPVILACGEEDIVHEIIWETVL
jgi:hypothetical protein